MKILREGKVGRDACGRICAKGFHIQDAGPGEFERYIEMGWMTEAPKGYWMVWVLLGLLAGVAGTLIATS